MSDNINLPVMITCYDETITEHLPEHIAQAFYWFAKLLPKAPTDKNRQREQKDRVALRTVLHTDALVSAENFRSLFERLGKLDDEDFMLLLGFLDLFEFGDDALLCSEDNWIKRTIEHLLYRVVLDGIPTALMDGPEYTLPVMADGFRDFTNSVERAEENRKAFSPISEEPAKPATQPTARRARRKAAR